MNDATVVPQSSTTVLFYIEKVSSVRFTAATVYDKNSDKLSIASLYRQLRLLTQCQLTDPLL